VGKRSETGRPLGIGSEWEIWLVTKCLDVNEGKDTASRLVEEGISKKSNPTDLISKVSRMAPQPILISPAVI
jgi:hypothetical protein